MSAYRALLLLGLMACSTRDERPSNNTCSEQSDCPGESRCDEAREQCVSERTSAPYDLVLQISQLGPRAGGLNEYAFPAFKLDSALSERDLDVPEGLRISGNIVGARSGETEPVPLNAELEFLPGVEPVGVAVTPVVVTSSKQQSSDTLTNYRATLADNRAYTVTIYPLGRDSAYFPPARVPFAARAEQPRFDFTYPKLEPLALKLVELDAPAPNVEAGERWVRIRAGRRKEPSDSVDPYSPNDVVSSLGTVAADGRVTVYVLPNVLEERDYRLEVSLFSDLPWNEVIEVPAARVQAVEKGPVVLPAVPAKVEYKGKVEAGRLDAVPRADVTFYSEFPVPNEPGDVKNRDWCRAKTPGDVAPPFACRATVKTSSDEEGYFTTYLLPGKYRVFISPSLENQSSERAKTTGEDTTVETQPGGAPQQGQAFPLGRAALVRGSVFGLSGIPLPNVVVRVIPLGLVGKLGDAAAYNRSSDALSNARGEFSLAVDTGYFDVLAQAPDDSGYPWVLIANREIDPGKMDVLDISGFVLPAPVLVEGSATSGGEALSGAQVDAYAVVRNLGRPDGRRGLLIGRATVAEDGTYTLQLPLSVPDEPNER